MFVVSLSGMPQARIPDADWVSLMLVLGSTSAEALKLGSAQGCASCVDQLQLVLLQAHLQEPCPSIPAAVGALPLKLAAMRPLPAAGRPGGLRMRWSSSRSCASIALTHCFQHHRCRAPGVATHCPLV